MEFHSKHRDFFKLKVAIFFGYNGIPFHFPQKNKEVLTIEQTLEKALFENDLIPNYNFGYLKKTGWKRACRTDKGVLAIANVINCKLAIKKKYIEEIVIENPSQMKIEPGSTAKGGEEEKKDISSTFINKAVHKNRIDIQKIINCTNALLKDIHVFAIRKVSKHFDSKQSARSRSFEYLIPTWCFKKLEERADTSLAFDLKILEKINHLTKKFIGQKNFHNFTRKMKPRNPRARRNIIEFDAKIMEMRDLTTPEKLAEYNREEIKNLRYFLFRIKGQSFIYHQLRKMMGIMVQVFQLGLPEEYIDNSLAQSVVRVWVAPTQGLFLNRVSFDTYNKTMDIPESLDFTEQEVKIKNEYIRYSIKIKEEHIENFRRELVYPFILDAELKERIFTSWLKIVCNPQNAYSESEDDGETGWES